MASPIKAVPILSGEIADDFIRKAEEREKNPAPGLSHELYSQGLTMKRLFIKSRKLKIYGHVCITLIFSNQSFIPVVGVIS